MSQSDRVQISLGDRMDGNQAPSKYHREIRPGVWIDVYDLLALYAVTNPADAHAIKKLLMPGQRGGKGAKQDRTEAIQAIQRAIELEAQR
jgi:hypothetical protein